jgi:hypothetical protein
MKAVIKKATKQKVAKNFTALLDTEWRELKGEAKRVCKGDPDKVTVEHRPGAGTLVALRSEVEHILREHGQPPARQPTPMERRKSLEAKRKRADALRRAVVDDDDLPPLARKQLADALSEADRLYARGIEDVLVSMHAVRQAAMNAAMSHVDECFEALIGVWIEIGGRLPKDRPKLITFLQACLVPALGPISHGAIDKRLRRLGY